ncbi:Polysaccharide biosynthesis protein GtrA [Sphingobium herbicidovorans NBRC 16415]|uniref:Polysaccharide biosynthesis protein GtrA n=1 Tax=Sphingobium herbicidovorans (strain ATCC 700291 / DSM 11019 / CCUG 56400 / KCTC 2939 / LMG 18315 / NBRC 16415 / MH) TaxID=1219045 RepID=A0A086PB16_SPHHM|nr:GtrA family protein [Sphingobium herbicidovorans]KFG90584.1 Polysaccharide biosynthesis protein GtrA [Sphingobium herbicidovorans NBRC 16415]
MKLLSRLPPERRALFWQVVRYGISGLFITACQAVVYWTLAALAGWHPQVANGIGYLAAVMIGYVTHSAFTFRGQGGDGNHAARGVKFVVVSLLSYALNALWVFLCVTHMRWPEWSPIPAMIFVTPAVMFGINRQWVFR